jgi:DNA (cytosine-5)-methyltransferase 1
MLRVISEARPAWILGENVPGIIPMELDNVLSDLEGIGYSCRSFVIPACAVDARHRRDRLWIVGRNMGNADQRGIRCAGASGNQGHIAQPSESLADSEGAGLEGGIQKTRREGAFPSGSDSEMADAASERRRRERSASEALREPGEIKRFTGCSSGQWCEWEPESRICRVAHGVPSRMDRLKGLGNSIVPQLAYEILKEIRNIL